MISEEVLNHMDTEGNIMNNENNGNNLVFLLAGFGLGAIIGAAAGLAFAPKPGNEMRNDVADRVKELKGKTQTWLNEQRNKSTSALASPEEVGA